MKKSELITIVAKKAHLTKKASSEAIETTFEQIIKALTKGEKVVLSGFGTFRIKKVEDKKGRKSVSDPTPIIHKSHRVVRFSVAKGLKKSVR